MNVGDMSPLARSVYEKLKSSIGSSQGARGRIVSYDYIAKYASVQTVNPGTKEEMLYHKVPVEDHGRGIHLTSLKPGTEVWVTFNGDSKPTITTIFTERNSKEDSKVHYGSQVNRYTSYL